NKADGDNIKRATTAAAEYRVALHLLNPKSPNWSPPVVTYSALTGNGIAELWGQVALHRERMNKTGEHAALRREQQVKWMWSMLNDRVFARLKSDSNIRSRLPALEADVAAGRLSATLAVEKIAGLLGI